MMNRRQFVRAAAAGAAGFARVVDAFAGAATYDLVIKGGRVIDPSLRLDAVRDVAIAGGRIAAVAEHLDPATALKTIDVSDLYVTPGLVDMHTHVYAGTG
ncbi:MAG TPA: hypothetical protein VN654_29825, partial [Vicinamibacterales bacterium]|nr:hypothetical protein [Vicinamibacterales bacterium]